MSTIGLNIRVPKQSLIKLSHHENQQLVIKFNGGRQIHGKLKSWDKTMNLILDNSCEIVGVDKKEKQEIRRQLGLVIVKGSQIESIAMKNGHVLIDNPYQLAEGDNEEQQQENEQDKEQEQQQNEKRQDKK